MTVAPPPSNGGGHDRRDDHRNGGGQDRKPRLRRATVAGTIVAMTIAMAAATTANRSAGQRWQRTIVATTHRYDNNRNDHNRNGNHNNWNGHRGWDRPRSDWNNHPNYWDNRRHDRRDYARYRYHNGYYRAPHGYHYRSWHRGDYLPRAYYGSSYIVYDWRPVPALRPAVRLPLGARRQ